MFMSCHFPLQPRDVDGVLYVDFYGISTVNNQPHLQCLCPLGNPDPTDLINAETNRIPFRAENFSLDLWKDAFRSWPSPTKGWKDWFLRVSHSNEVQWGERKLDQCIRLSLADMHRNESLLVAASYFWSDTLNALFLAMALLLPLLPMCSCSPA